MSEPFLGEIRVFAGNFAPRGWALCNGQVLSISQNTALFSILGTTYGGNGVNNFALPDLQGNAAVHQGSSFNLGETAGEESHTLTVEEMPAHTHNLNAAAGAITATPSTAVLLGTPAAQAPAYAAAGALTPLSPNAIAPTTGNQPHENRQPYLVLNYIIALQGVFPTRN
ncbi:MAG TPA: tail fiber protein [Stellaceae bacterium]|nr:tail fiber protein [Stellaceae bacterium]